MSRLDEILPNATEVQKLEIRTLMLSMFTEAVKEDTHTKMSDVFIEKVREL